MMVELWVSYSSIVPLKPNSAYFIIPGFGPPQLAIATLQPALHPVSALLPTNSIGSRPMLMVFPPATRVVPAPFRMRMARSFVEPPLAGLFEKNGESHSNNTRRGDPSGTVILCNV